MASRYPTRPLARISSTAVVTSRTQAGKVVQQSPLAGNSAPQNAQVVVFLGAFKTS